MEPEGIQNKMSESSHRLTADKREIKDLPKLPTSFIRNTLYAMGFGTYERMEVNICRANMMFIGRTN